MKFKVVVKIQTCNFKVTLLLESKKSSQEKVDNIVIIEIVILTSKKVIKIKNYKTKA